MKSIIDSSINIRAMQFIIEFLLTKFRVVIWQHMAKNNSSLPNISVRFDFQNICKLQITIEILYKYL